MKISSILGIFVFFGFCQTAVAEDCFSYMPDKASIQGRLSIETLSTAEGKTDKYFFMHPSSPVCVAPTAEDGMNKPVHLITKIQLSFRDEAPAMNQKLQSYLDGETMRCSGYFFSWHTDHHFTPVLMFTKECDPVAPATAAIAPAVVH
ncbi:MAG TPA: DUF4431 domain-containing protein [Gammaproteobacteria bacterium]|nr:DUF4431 domain-containing protein [Gammaproteobacteria bacterium]